MALRGWLNNRKEKSIMKSVVEFTQKVLETVHEFERGYNFLAKEKNIELAGKVFTRVLKLEHEADHMRREILLEITKSDFNNFVRQDLMILVKRIDEIANKADKASRAIIGLKYKPLLILGDSILEIVHDMIQRTVDAMKLLFGLIKRFGEMSDEEVFKTTGTIDQIEHECDLLHTKFYMEVNDLEEVSLKPCIAIQIVKFIDLIEAISNRIEDVCDYIDLIKTLESQG